MENSNELPRGEWGSDKNILFAVRDLLAAADLDISGVSVDFADGQLVIHTGCDTARIDGFGSPPKLVRVTSAIRMHTEFDETVDAVG